MKPNAKETDLDVKWNPFKLEPTQPKVHLFQRFSFMTCLLICTWFGLCVLFLFSPSKQERQAIIVRYWRRTVFAYKTIRESFIFYIRIIVSLQGNQFLLFSVRFSAMISDELYCVEILCNNTKCNNKMLANWAIEVIHWKLWFSFIATADFIAIVIIPTIRSRVRRI